MTVKTGIAAQIEGSLNEDVHEFLMCQQDSDDNNSQISAEDILNQRKHKAIGDKVLSQN